MTYLKDRLTNVVRVFDEEVPKEARMIKRFLKAKVYDYDSDENTSMASRGRWSKTTKTEYTKYTKECKAIEVESVEVD